MLASEKAICILLEKVGAIQSLGEFGSFWTCVMLHKILGKRTRERGE